MVELIEISSYKASKKLIGANTAGKYIVNLEILGITILQYHIQKKYCIDPI
jgi:hypothetical protein